MIKFFRKIRQRLLTENKFSKYLLYAIGEIILVVIGILIALQINNWNENQKLVKLEKELLREVKIGLESDYNLISTSINEHKRFINSQDIIVSWIDEKFKYNDSLIPHFKHTIWTHLFFPKNAPFESLNQFGMRNITNKNLRDQISNLYDVTYEDIDYWQNEYKKTSIDFRSTFNELFVFIEEEGKRSLDIRPLSPSSLQSNEVYLYNLKVTRSTLDLYTNGKLKNAQKEIERTTKMIGKELTKG